jgi:hypothetical protein
VNAAGATPRFTLCWRIIQPGSGVIRRIWLRAIERPRQEGRAMTRRWWLSLVVLGLMLAVPGRAAAQTPGAAGHWTGTIEIPDRPMQVEVDLKPGAPPAWVGTISIPAQNLRFLPLTGIDVQGKAVTFVIPSAPGTPTFKGTLSDDGTTMSGDFAQGGAAFPFKLTRAGDAVSAPPPAKSTPITKDLEGTWSGTLQAGGQSLRLTLKLASGADGATGSIVSVDQGNAEVPIASVVQTGTHLELELPQISGKYSADLKNGTLVGVWTQGPGTMPLEFTRVP